MKNLSTRALTGLIYVAVIVAGVLGSQAMFMGLGCLLGGLAIAEYSKLTEGGGRELRPMTLLDITGALIMITGFASIFHYYGTSYVKTYSVLYLAYVITRLLFSLYSKSSTTLRELFYSLGGQVYIAVPLSLMAVIRSSAMDGGRWLLLALFIFIWCNDTGAYLVGSKIGKHRLFERISPKKSWEGFFGGVAFAIGAGAVLRGAFPEQYGSWSWLFMLGLGLTTAIFATWGDLVESLIKRTTGVKDSGHLLPGHGGILDRIDSLLMAVPAGVIYLLLFT